MDEASKRPASRKPLNGERTHPLSQHALSTLRRIAVAPVPRQEVNPGVANRLEREELVRGLQLKSPYASRKGTVEHLEITEAGRSALAESSR